MSTFEIYTHGRLQEWVAQLKGYFEAEGLTDYRLTHQNLLVSTTEENRRVGAYQIYEKGTNASVSCACHWTVNMAASNQHGRIWANCYSVSPAGIFVRDGARYQQLKDLADVEIDVGFQSGSHYATIQGMETALAPEQIKLRFAGAPYPRLEKLLNGDAQASTLFGAQMYIAEQLGFRKLADVSFIVISMVPEGVGADDVKKYYAALRRAQADIDVSHQAYARFWLSEMPAKYHGMVNVDAFGPGERLVFEPYSEDMYNETHKWVEDRKIFLDEKVGRGTYEEATIVA